MLVKGTINDRVINSLVAIGVVELPVNGVFVALQSRCY